MNSTTRAPRRTTRTRTATIATVALVATVTSFAGASTASADTTAAIKRGDIAFTTSGGVFDGGAGVDRLDPITLQRSRVASFGAFQGQQASDVVADATGDLYVWGTDETITKIDHTTGTHTQVFDSSAQISDIAIDNDGKLLLLVSDNSGFAVQRVTSSYRATTISRDGLLADDAQGIQPLADGRIVVGTNSGLVEITAKTGAQKRISTFRAPLWTMDTDGTVYFVSPSGPQPWIKKFAYNDPDHISNVSTWYRYAHLSDMIVDADHTVVLIDYNDDGRNVGDMHIDRMNPANGRANTLTTVGWDEARGLAVAGVSLHPTPTPAPITMGDSYTGQQDQKIYAAPYDGVLANDSDPRGKKLSIASPGLRNTDNGQIDLHADGSFQYTPEAAFSGYDGFSYRATNGSLQSRETWVSIKVEAKHQSPTAKPDTYQVKAGAKFSTPAPGVLANDTSPTQLKLQALLVSQPKHGTLALSGNGAFTYTPASGFKGQDQFSYQDYDDSGIDGFSVPATVTLTVK